MKIPEHVLIIGTADLIRYLEGDKTRPKCRTLHNHILAVNKTFTTLFIFPCKTTGGQKQIKNPMVFSTTTTVKYNVPSLDLKKVGTIDLIQYSTEWFDGDYWNCGMEKYEHTFDTPAMIYADRQSRFTVMGIRSKKGNIFSQEGIIG